MPNYAKTIIYKLINYDCPDLVYVGSTTNFTKRKAKHKKNTNENVNTKVHKTIRDNGGWESWNMIKICDYPCNTSIEARQEEDRQMIELKSNLNSNRAYVSTETKKTEKAEYDKQYYIVNKEKKSEYDKQYYIVNKEKKSEYDKQYREANNQKIREYKKQYYENNKEKWVNLSNKVNCECGCTVRKNGLIEHRKTIKHHKLIKALQ